MNKKYVLKNADNGTVITCIIDAEKSIEDQLLELFQIRKGTGFSFTVRESEIELMDYFHASSCAMFNILSVEDTDLPAPAKLVEDN